MAITSSSPVALNRLPLLGHAWALYKDPLAFLESLPDAGDLVRVDLGPQPLLFVTTAELTQHVLTDARTFDKGGALFDKVRTVTGDGLLTSRYDPHKRQRRLLQPAFTRERVQGHTRTMHTMTSAVLEGWEDGAVVDVSAAMYDLTARTAARTMFAAHLDSAATTAVVRDLSIFLEGLFVRMVSPSQLLTRVPLPANLRYGHAVRRIHGTVDAMIAAYRADGTDHGDLLSMLLRADGGEGALTDAEVHDQVVTLFLAGIETTAATLAWSLHLLSVNPSAAARLRAEVDQVLQGRPAQWADIPRLELTMRVVTEAMRLYPPGWIFTRVATVDTTLGSHHVPAGTSIAYSPFLLHRSPAHFPRPLHFDPDRWLPGGATSNARSAFVPFGGGARKCIGDTFGVTEAVLALATITADWDLLAEDTAPVRPRARHATLTPDKLLLRAHRRR